ncbi:MAG: hypothetical protein PHQ23_08120 [Candidatus Wallbacteria bacterium]|nr:hypothetical protein [Candidatus Wallbacteria bacterium]
MYSALSGISLEARDKLNIMDQKIINMTDMTDKASASSSQTMKFGTLGGVLRPVAPSPVTGKTI